MQHFWKLFHRNDEWFDILNLEGIVVGAAPRRVCHRRPGLIHPVVHLHLVGSGGRVYLQKRAASKKIQPGKWDTSVGGHLDRGEAVEAALYRESREELGIIGFNPIFISSTLWESEVETELVHSFAAFWDGPVTINTDEIDEGRFWKFSEIERNLGRELFTPNFEYEYGKVAPMLKGVKQ